MGESQTESWTFMKPCSKNRKRIAWLAIAALSLFVQRPGIPLPAPTVAQPVLKPNLKRDFDPTFSNYQMVANRSLEELDELLTRQGNRNPPPIPIYTASTLPRANVPD